MIFVLSFHYDTISVSNKLYKTPTEATTTLEALEQRLQKYRSTCDEAKQQENASKARRMQRITKVTQMLHSKHIRIFL